MLQAEFSVTQMLDAPVTGRIFFDQLIRDNLDLGRPDRVSLIFDRRIVRRGKRATPGRFRTRVITDGVVPSLHVDYKNSKIKQYHKLGKALRCSRPLRMSMTAAFAVATQIRAFRASDGGLVVMVAVIWSGCRGAGSSWPR